MRLTHTIVGALALVFPALPALAEVPPNGYYGAPYTAPQPERTQLRVAPPPGGSVYVYEGHRLLGRFDRPGSMMVATGRSYRIVAMRGDEQLWRGDVAAS